ncbi:MAG: cell division protein ZapA [Trichlorobacter sp.]|jgi:cell division protein ZapA|nr:cell division protein ZapA [Trichlorobacter sp.]
MKTTYQLTVLGREIPVRSSAPEKQVRAVESFVNSRLDDIQNSVTTADTHLVSLLALLNLAEEHLKMARNVTIGSTELKTKVEQLLQKIDSATDL